MKIKTITCHDVYNVGASLQAYALATYLKSLGHDTEIIDYKPEYLQHFKLFGSVSGRYNRPILREIYHIVKFPGRLKARLSKRKKQYDIFTAKFLPITSKCYHSNEELKKDPPEADLFFAGSDQIWNTLFPNGKDPAFYLDFAPEKAIKASYAASFATKDIDEEYKEQVKKWLLNFDFISVREGSGLDIIHSFGIADAVQVLDPVFLLSLENWQKIEKNLNVKERYVLLYDFDNNIELCNYARELADQNNYKVYSILPSKVADRCFSEEGPNAFLYLIHHSEFVVSNSFHATAFSIIFQKPFVVFNRSENINTRMADLVSSVGLSDRIIDYSFSIQQKNEIDFGSVQLLLNGKIQESKQYINMVLRKVGELHEERDPFCN